MDVFRCIGVGTALAAAGAGSLLFSVLADSAIKSGIFVVKVRRRIGYKKVTGLLRRLSSDRALFAYAFYAGSQAGVSLRDGSGDVILWPGMKPKPEKIDADYPDE